MYLPQVGGFHEKSPEIAFSDRVDAVLKNFIETYYFIAKLRPSGKGFLAGIFLDLHFIASREDSSMYANSTDHASGDKRSRMRLRKNIEISKNFLHVSSEVRPGS